MLISIKYHVPSKGITGQNQIWRIYENVDRISTAGDFNGMSGTGVEYVEHIEIEDCDAWTGESLFRVGYSLILEGEVEYYNSNGLRCARIFSGE